MNADELADLVVAVLNEIEDSPIQFTAVKPEYVPECEVETGPWKVFVCPYSEIEEPITLGNETCREEFTVNVIISGSLKAPLTKTEGMEFVKLLRESLKGTELGGLLWNGNEVVSIFDSEALKTKQQFLSLFRATYYDFA